MAKAKAKDQDAEKEEKEDKKDALMSVSFEKQNIIRLASLRNSLTKSNHIVISLEEAHASRICSGLLEYFTATFAIYSLYLYKEP